MATTGSERTNGDSPFLVMAPQPMPPPELQIAAIAQGLGVFEGQCVSEGWQVPNPAKFRAFRAYVGIFLSSLDYIAEASAAGFWKLSDEQLNQLDELRDRADELIDTLSWSADAPEALADLASKA